MAVRPPSTPPYILMLFAFFHLLPATAKFTFDAIDHRGNTVFNILRIAVPALFLWVAGTLPLQEVRCAPNIARSKDASFLFLLGVPLIGTCRYRLLHFPVRRMMSLSGLGLHSLLLNQFLNWRRQEL